MMTGIINDIGFNQIIFKSFELCLALTFIFKLLSLTYKLCASLVEVFDAVYLSGRVHGEGNPVQRAAARHTAETGGVVRTPSRTQDLTADRRK